MNFNHLPYDSRNINNAATAQQHGSGIPAKVGTRKSSPSNPMEQKKEIRNKPPRKMN